VLGFDLILERLAAMNAQLVDAYIDTKRTEDLPVADRRLDPGPSLTYPVELRQINDLKDLRASLLRSMRTTGQSPFARGSGNNRKRTRLVVATERGMSATELAELLKIGIPGELIVAREIDAY
jgi:hypothetical protein